MDESNVVAEQQRVVVGVDGEIGGEDAHLGGLGLADVVGTSNNFD